MDKLHLDKAEKLIRGAINFLPRGAALEKTLFALKDAEKEKFIEDNIEFIQGQLRGVSIDLLDTQIGVGEILKQIKINSELLKNYELFVEERENSLQKIIETGFSQQAERMEKIKNDIIDQLQSSGNQNPEILKRLLSKMNKQIKELIDNYDLDKALKEIKELQDVLMSEALDPLFVNELKAKEGIIYLKQNQKEMAKPLKEKIIESEKFSESIVDFILMYSAIAGDITLKDSMIEKYIELGIEDKKIRLQEAYFLNAQGESEVALKQLATVEYENYSLKSEFVDSWFAMFLIGIIMMKNQSYDKAQEFFSDSLKIKNDILTKFYMLIAAAHQIIDKKSIILALSNEDKTQLEKIYNELSGSEFTGHKFQTVKHLNEEYWIQRLTLHYHFDAKKALDEFNLVDEDIKKRKLIRYVYCDILVFNERFDKAEDELLNLYKEYSENEILRKYLISLLGQKKFPQIVDFFKRIENASIEDEEGVFASIYLEALKSNEVEDVIELAQSYIKKIKKPIYVYRFLANFYDDAGEKEKAIENYNYLIKSINEDQYYPRLTFAEEMFLRDYMDEAIVCLKPLVSFSYVAEKRYVQFVLKARAHNYYPEVDLIILNHLKAENDNVFWYSAKADLEHCKNNFYTSLKFTGEVFKIEKTPEAAFNYALLILTLNKDEFYDSISILEKSSNPDHIMLAAACYNHLGSYKKAEMLSVISMAQNGEEINNRLFLQFLQVNFFSNITEKETVEYTEITSECCVRLVSDEDDVWIGITADREILYEKNNYKFIDATFYYKNDIEILPLVSAKRLESVIFKQHKYTVQEILTIKTRAIRYILSKIEKAQITSPYFKLLKVNENDPLSSIKPDLVEVEILDKHLYDLYNLKNQIGIPLYIVSKNRGGNLYDTIIHLLTLKNQPFYTGEVNYYDLNNAHCILSPSSITLLSILDILQNVRHSIPNLIITTSSYEYFKKIITKIDDFEKRSTGSMGINDGNFRMNDYDSKFHETRRKYFIKILEILNDINIVTIENTPEELDEFSSLINSISICDFDGLKFAHSNNCIYICDDLVVRKARGIFNPGLPSTNSIPVITHLYKHDVEKLLEIFGLLATYKYSYLYNDKILLIIVNGLLSKSRIIGPTSLYGQFIQIIYNSLTIPVSFYNNLDSLIRVLNYLYYKRSYTGAMYLIEEILHKILLIMSLHSIDERNLSERLAKIIGGDSEKLEFFESVLRKVNQL